VHLGRSASKCTTSFAVKDSYLVFTVNDVNIVAKVPVNDGKTHEAYIEKLGKEIR
jgi:hypothetical protein